MRRGAQGGKERVSEVLRSRTSPASSQDGRAPRQRGQRAARVSHHCARREDVRADRERLPEFDEEWAERDDGAAQVGGAADLEVLRVAHHRVVEQAEREPGALGRDLQHAREDGARPLAKVRLERLGLEEGGELVVDAGGRAHAHDIHLHALVGHQVVVQVGPAQRLHHEARVIVLHHARPHARELFGHVGDGGGGRALGRVDGRHHPRRRAPGVPRRPRERRQPARAGRGGEHQRDVHRHSSECDSFGGMISKNQAMRQIAKGSAEVR